MGVVSRFLALGVPVLALACGSDRLRPLEQPQPKLPPTHNVPPPEGPTEELPPEDPAPEEDAPCTCAPTTNDGCANNGRCDDSGACIYDTVANGTACTADSLAGECIDRYCIPFDTRTYGAPHQPSPPWCPDAGVGLPATQTARPVGGASCTIYIASQTAYGNCPLQSYPMWDFEDTSLANRNRVSMDLRWLKFDGVISLRVRMPDEPSSFIFDITDFANGGGLGGYKVSISDEPCDVGNVVSRYDADHCERPGLQINGFIDAVDPLGTNPCTKLRAGHIYYFNIKGDGPADPGSDGIIDAGERLLLWLRFDKR